MQLKQFMNLLLVALFISAFQGTLTHFTEHTIASISECQVCEHTKNLDIQHHETPLSNFYTATRAFTTQVEQLIVVNTPVDLTQSVAIRHVDLIGLKALNVRNLPLGFNATAPPYIFS